MIIIPIIVSFLTSLSTLLSKLVLSSGINSVVFAIIRNLIITLLFLFLIPFFNKHVTNIYSKKTIINILLIGCIGALSILCYYYALHNTNKPSIVVALSSISPIFATILFRIFFNEKLSLLKYIGIVLITCGSFLCAF